MTHQHPQSASRPGTCSATTLVFLLVVGVFGRPAALRAQAASDAAPTRLTRDAAVALKASTLGVGLEFGKLLGSHAAVRVGGHALTYDRATAAEEGANPTTYGLALRNGSGTLDLFPGRRGAFRLSVGVVGGSTSLTSDGREALELQPNDDGSGNAFTGTLTERVTYPTVRPYAGLGWGTPATHRGGIGFVADFGVLYGKPTYTLTATGTGANTPEVQAAVARQRDEMRADVERYGRFYPVVGFGLAYRF